MAKHEFTATHGVQFTDQVTDPKSKEILHETWAHFVRDFDAPERDGYLKNTYRFSTDDDTVASRLNGISEYGITEAAQPAEAPADPAQGNA